MRTPIRVVKVGGSLFDLHDLADRLRRWLTDESPAHHVLIAGGGALVDRVREWNARDPLDVVSAHWKCIDLMAVTAQLLHVRLPEIVLTEDDRLLCQRVGIRGCTIFGPAEWLRRSEPGIPGKKLPPSWDVTSDSIAARLAVGLEADELVLLKSVLPPPEAGTEVCKLSAAGYVDRMMGELAQELPPVRLVNLRGSAKPSELLQIQLPRLPTVLDP